MAKLLRFSSPSSSTTTVLLAVLFLLGIAFASITEISRITYPAQQFVTPGNFFGSDYLAVAIFNPEYNNQSFIETVRVFDALSFIPEKEQKGFLGVEATNSLRKFASGADEDTSKVVYFANAKQKMYKILLHEDGSISQAAVTEVADQCTQISNLWTRKTAESSRVYYACRAEQEFLLFAHDASDLRKLSSIVVPSSSLLKASINPATGAIYYVEASGSPVSGITEVALKRISVDDATEENLGVFLSRAGSVDEIYSMMFDTVNNKIFLNIDAKLFKLDIQNTTVEVEAVVEVPNQKAPEQHDVYSVLQQAPEQQDTAVLVYQDTADQFSVAKVSLNQLALADSLTIRNDNVEYTKLESVVFTDAGTFVVVFQNMIGKFSLVSINCPAGQVFHRNNACADCAAGSFRNDTAAYPLDLCPLCPVGTFSKSKASTKCEPCPTALTAGATECPDPGQSQRGLITLLVVSGVCALVIVVGMIIGFLLLFKARAKKQQSQYDEVQ